MENTGTGDRISTLIADRAGIHLEEPATSLDLAALQPLSHSNAFLSAETFSVESFLISRSHTSLSDFRAELRDYHGVLKEELVRLINDDYAAFISLSTDLRGEGPRVEKLKHPLASLKQDTQLSIDQLKQVEETIQNKLNERTALREEKARLHVLLKLSETLTRLESLLLIAKEEPSDAAFGGIPARIIASSDQNSLETRFRTNRVKHVSRIAAEFNQLLYLMDKVKQDKFAFLSEVQWRADRVKSTLSSDLNHLFSVLLLAHSSVESVGSSDFDRGRWKSDIKECLSIYDSIGNWREAEEVIRRELMTPFIRQTIFSGALVVPHSPLAPRTPFMTHGASFGPSTPKTPYTAFPFTPWPRKAEEHFLPSDFPLSLLDDQNNPLAGIYNKILRFTERDLKLIMELAETVSERYRQSTTSIETLGSPNDTPGFEIMSNVIWADIGRAVMEGLGSTIFAAGRPDDFHENYTTTQSFIAALEVLAPSLHAVTQMRNHPVYLSFQKRWQLSVYFQLRWKEIVGNLESALTLSLPRKNVIEDGAHEFLIPQTQACYTAMCSCWSEGIYIPAMCHRFWRLTLQILNRYCLWLESFDGHATDTENTNTQSTLTAEESGTLSDVSNEKMAMEDTTLYQCGLLISDIKTFERKVMEFWNMHISVILSDSEGKLRSPLAVLKQTLARPLDLVPKLGSHIVSILVRRCCENLIAVRSVPSQYRALPNKRMPVAPSPFVADVLRPAKSFFITLSDTLKNDLGNQWIAEIFDAVCTRYALHLAFTKKTEESLRRLKKGKKSAFPLFGSSTSSSSDIDGKDEERVRAQMMLDVTALGDGARDLGVDISQSSHFKELRVMASAVDIPP